MFWGVIGLKILEYKPDFGTFSAGFESFSQNEVVETVKLDENSAYGYNRIHKQWAPASLSSIATYEPEKHVDLAIFHPEFGEKVSRKGRKNFFFYDFQSCLSFLENNRPLYAIFKTEVDVIPHVNNAPDYVRDGFGQLSKDRIIYSLQQMGYKAYLVVLDEADYGIPIHRSFAFYVGVPEDVSFSMPKPLFTATGRGEYSRYRSVGEAIGDLGGMGDWVEYLTPALNSYQKWLRDDDVGRVTWHHPPNIKDSTKKRISCVKQGSNNETLKPFARSRGYNRAVWGDVCRAMDESFYLVLSRGGDSIHPIQNRPFTIREGCRIHGLPDRLSFDLSTSRKDLARKIHNSAAPAIGQIFSIAFGQIK